MKKDMVDTVEEKLVNLRDGYRRAFRIDHRELLRGFFPRVQVGVQLDAVGTMTLSTRHLRLAAW